MTFYGKLTETDPPRKLRKFAYRLFNNGMEHEVDAHEIYFYEAGRIGFWNDTDGDETDDRVLLLATKAFDVREVVGDGRET